MRRRLALLAVVMCSAAACRYLGPATPLKGPDQPQLNANGNPGDPTRAQPIPARRCVVDCAPGWVCDEKLAECVLTRTGRPDAGPAWLP